MSPKNVIFSQMSIRSAEQAQYFLSNAILFYGYHFQVLKPIEAYHGCDCLTGAQQHAFESNRKCAIAALKQEGICPEHWCAINAL